MSGCDWLTFESYWLKGWGEFFDQSQGKMKGKKSNLEYLLILS